ncbi:MAG: hypothetical protein JW797_00925 [Bradymonadales bacterium]|nr:hypothetical protein [Bradymonadales bacterium]
MATLVALLSWAGVGCGSADIDREEWDSAWGRARHNSLRIEGLTSVAYDLDQDGENDQWCYYDGGTNVLVRVERDIDFDGRIDLYEHYDRQGRLVEEEMHLDFDRRIDVVRYYRGDTLVRRELATGFDGRFTLAVQYDARGEVLRIEQDTDGDGRFDTLLGGSEIAGGAQNRDGLATAP